MEPAEWDVVVIGAGAAGLLAAARAAERGRRTLLLEKNRRPGIKVLMSGGTRCNLTHATDRRGIVEAFGRQGKFLHSALAALGPQELVDLFEAEGLPTKVEATGKIFPVSDRASDVLEALLRRLARSGVELRLEQPAVDLARREPGGFTVFTSKGPLAAAQVILTTGGQSYPGSGTTGDGYRFVTALGHSLVPPRPALTPITVDAAWVRELTGLTAPDVTLEVVPPSEGGGAAAGPPLAAARGSLLFTHFGLSGPVALDVSRAVSGCADPRSLRLRCDFLPGTPPAELERFALPDGAGRGGKTLAGLTSLLLPRRLADAILGAAGLPSQRKIAELSKADRVRWLATLTGCLIPVTGTRGFGKAEVTAGGVPLDEVDSRTMQSKLVPGLYLAGEILDLDGPIGGYNFQAAFSTGWLAGESVA